MKLKTTYMNKSKRLFCKLAFAALGLLPTMATTALADTTDYTQYVNPFVGNADNFPGGVPPVRHDTDQSGDGCRGLALLLGVRL